MESQLEFTTRLRGSEFKNALDGLSLGAEVEVEGPYGSFTLQEGTGPVVFVSGGIGITCVRSILLWLAGRDGAPAAVPTYITVLAANSSEESIPFRDELERLKAQLPMLRVVNIISEPGEGWRGYRGHLDQSVLRRELSEPRGRTYYVSGPPTFVEAAREELLAWGAEPAWINAERFEGYE